MACSCELCSECGGSGDVYVAFGGQYLGKHRSDDLDELETCPLCGGDGLEYECQDCQMGDVASEEQP